MRSSEQYIQKFLINGKSQVCIKTKSLPNLLTQGINFQNWGKKHPKIYALVSLTLFQTSFQYSLVTWMACLRQGVITYTKSLSDIQKTYQKELFSVIKTFSAMIHVHVCLYVRNTKCFRFLKSMFRISHFGYHFRYQAFQICYDALPSTGIIANTLHVYDNSITDYLLHFHL